MLRGVRRKLGKAIRERGLLGTAVLTERYLVDRVRDLGPRRRRQFRASADFDRAHDIDTGGRIPLGDLDVEHEAWREGNRYEAAVPREFRDLIEKLPGPLERFTFIDLGSGKGRALLLASEYPFNRIIGVELAHELHEICLRNVRNYRSATQRCRKIESHCADATSFALPPEPIVLFLNNPFSDTLWRKLLARLRDSLRAQPREVRVIVANADRRAILAEVPELRLVDHGADWGIWTSTAPA
jgi:SAM-dependent methyltransferase